MIMEMKKPDIQIEGIVIGESGRNLALIRHPPSIYALNSMISIVE